MARKVTLGGLSLAAIGATMAFMAASASAFFDASVEHVIVEGSNSTSTGTASHVFTTSVGTIACKKAAFLGTSIGTDFDKDGIYTHESQTVTPTYSECTAFGFSATVITTGCLYKFTRTGKDAEGTPIGPVHIECEAGKKIKIVVAGFCTMEVGSQTPNGHVGFKTTSMSFPEGKEDVDAKSTVTGIKYEGNCGSGTNGTYAGETTLRGFDTAGKQVHVTVT